MKFELNDDYIQLDKLLKLCDFVDSGGSAHYMIDCGNIILNGNTVFEKRKKIRKGDCVCIKNSIEKIEVI